MAAHGRTLRHAEAAHERLCVFSWGFSDTNGSGCAEKWRSATRPWVWEYAPEPAVYTFLRERLNSFGVRTLFELHFHMITLGGAGVG